MPDREHANHNFTAVSIALNTDPAFPQVDAFDVNGDGVLETQSDRREQMLQAACTMVVGSGTTKKILAATDTWCLPLTSPTLALVMMCLLDFRKNERCGWN